VIESTYLTFDPIANTEGLIVETTGIRIIKP